ncbi:MAG: hypothetical protein EBU84_21910, partial [Actinobacteria bacterium]|nr:hypothetical protein [Actinomycetota bacterium]
MFLAQKIILMRARASAAVKGVRINTGCVLSAGRSASFAEGGSMLQKVLNTILSVFKKQDELTKELTQQITSQPAPASAHTEETEKKEPRLEPAEEDKLSKLYPHFAQLVRCFVLKARAEGMPVGIFCGLRTFEEQR